MAEARKTQGLSAKDRAENAKNRSVEERRRVSESFVRRQRGAQLNARRKQKLTELQKDAEYGAPIIFSDEEMRVAVRSAVEAVRSSLGCADHLRHLRYLRYLLTDGDDPPFQLLHQLDVASLLISELQSNESEIRSEALWALAFLADRDFATAQLLMPLASRFVPYLDHHAGYDVAELAAWIFHSLTSAMGEGELEAIDLATPLSELLFACRTSDATHVIDASMTAAWSLCSVVAHSAQARQQLLTIPHFAGRLAELLSWKNGRVVMEAAWLITYLVAADDAHLSALVQANVVSQLVQVLKLFLAEPHPDLSVVHGVLTPVLRSLGNIAVGLSLEHVHELIQHENGVILQTLEECLACAHRGIQKEACKTLSNIAAACDASIMETLIRSPALDRVIQFVGHSAFDIKREAAFVLANICFNRGIPNAKFLHYLLRPEYQIVPGIVSLMHGIDVETTKLGLDFTQLILEQISDGPQRIEEADGIDALDNLQFGQIPADIQDQASFLVDTYFGEDYGLD